MVDIAQYRIEIEMISFPLKLVWHMSKSYILQFWGRGYDNSPPRIIP